MAHPVARPGVGPHRFFVSGKIICNIMEATLSSAEYEQRVCVHRMSEPGLDLAACVERVRQRDEEAARRLLEHLYPLVLKLVRAHRPKRMAEEDLVQMVFIKVF